MATTVTNVRTKRKMKIAEDRYAPMAAAITTALRDGKRLPFADLLESVEPLLPQFSGSVSWYLITVVRDLESRGVVVCRPAGKRPVYALK